ncbi:hypothetical protein ABK040_000375 [Willaertia magna]
MQTVSTSPSPLSIDITLDKPYFTCGEQATGVCHLKVLSSTPIPANSLIVKWKGYERSNAAIPVSAIGVGHHPHHGIAHHHTGISVGVGHHHHHHSHTQYQIITDETMFFSQAFTVTLFEGGMIQPGEYHFPIYFQLPNGLPGIFSDHKLGLGVNCRAAVVYKVKCKLDNNYIPNSKISKRFSIVPNFSTIMCALDSHNEKDFLFGGSGKLYMDVHINKNVFTPGESVPVQIKVRNDSRKDVAGLKVKLMRDVTMKCHSYSHSYSEEVNRMVFEGVEGKNSAERVLNFKLAENIFPTSEGKLVKCNYHFDVECDVKLALDLEVHLPIHVFYHPSVVNQHISIYDNLEKGAWEKQSVMYQQTNPEQK